MASSQEILREYLVALGYKVDGTSVRKFEDSIGKTEALVGGLGAAVVSAGAAAVGMAAVFARSMEKMYYSSKIAGTTVGNLQAIEFAASTIGISGEKMRSTLQGFAMALRLNPGKQALLEQMGITVNGRDTTKIFDDFIDKMKELRVPLPIASQYANMFGISDEDFYLLSQGHDKLKEMEALRKQMAIDAGVDTEEAGKASVEYQNMYRELTERVGLLGQAVSVALLPVMREVLSLINSAVVSWSLLVKDIPGVVGVLKSDWQRTASDIKKDGAIKTLVRLSEGLSGHTAGGGVLLSANSQARLAGRTPPKPADAQAILGVLEHSFGLPAGTLDKFWNRESGRGKHLVSKAGAVGDFQLMPGTAKDMGVANPFSFVESSVGAAKYLRQLLDHYGGNMQLAAAAYNWGMGNVDRKGVGMAPKETRDYVQALTGQPLVVNQTTTINVVSSDPAAAGRSVAAAQQRVNEGMASVVRNQTAKIQ